MSSLQEPWKQSAELRSINEKAYANIEATYRDCDRTMKFVRLLRGRDDLGSKMCKFQEAYEQNLPEFEGLVKSYNKSNESDQGSGSYTGFKSALKRKFGGGRKKQYEETMDYLQPRWKELDAEATRASPPWLEVILATLTVTSSAQGTEDIQREQPGSSPSSATQIPSEAQIAHTASPHSDLDPSEVAGSEFGGDTVDAVSEQHGGSTRRISASFSTLSEK